MKKFVPNLVALFAGLLFGLGMMVSGMVDPERVIGFLDVAGNWDPSLAFVMGGALLVFVPSYQLLIKPRQSPVCSAEFKVSKSKTVDSRLVTGAALFGLGWGIAGVCPGPAVTSLSGFNPAMILFIATMLAGMLVGNYVTKAKG
ncbi:transporter [Photobacterium sanctipauli]|uniref:Transporter n=1 Tax=Photobacterium sanctipauli TaxID=1342794 RepID=A0A2T3NPY3_9GAMM|nr:YeeE/YedE family protein [Photobacterium sanctipauli]PSW18267.1 transporter [Photobacterium sanctipauli]